MSGGEGRRRKEKRRRAAFGPVVQEVEPALLHSSRLTGAGLFVPGPLPEPACNPQAEPTQQREPSRVGPGAGPTAFLAQRT